MVSFGTPLALKVDYLIRCDATSAWTCVVQCGLNLLHSKTNISRGLLKHSYVIRKRRHIARRALGLGQMCVAHIRAKTIRAASQ